MGAKIASESAVENHSIQRMRDVESLAHDGDSLISLSHFSGNCSMKAPLGLNSPAVDTLALVDALVDIGSNSENVVPMKIRGLLDMAKYLTVDCYSSDG